ncbi:MAG: phosphopyruvate hydratase [Patescibacteria group bacterium]|nr:phosphopyruvate hydratase [Patescibacteria group bacterium]
MNKIITDIIAEQIYDSRNNPTLKVSVYVEDSVGTFLVPSGASTGKYEAYELRDDNTGKGTVEKAIKQINEIIKPSLVGIDVEDQKKIDEIMINLDGTSQKTILGGNSMIGVSIACAKAAAKVNNIEVYEYLRRLSSMKILHTNTFLYFNLINGGKHTKTKLAFQEYHIVPQEKDIVLNIEMCKEIQNKLDEIIVKRYGSLPIKGDEGGIAINTENIEEPLSLLKEAVDSLNYTNKVMFALDVAANSFYDQSKNIYRFMDKDWDVNQMIELYKNISKKYPLISIEDPFYEEDYKSFNLLQNELPKTKIIGDDLTVTNINRLKKAIEMQSIEGIIIKPNQIGTLTETLNTMLLARNNNIECIISHRSGETMDDFISDLAFAFGCYGIKAGAIGPKERNAKYNRLIKISK